MNTKILNVKDAKDFRKNKGTTVGKKNIAFNISALQLVNFY